MIDYPDLPIIKWYLDNYGKLKINLIEFRRRRTKNPRNPLTNIPLFYKIRIIVYDIDEFIDLVKNFREYYYDNYEEFIKRGVKLEKGRVYFLVPNLGRHGGFRRYIPVTL